MAKTRELDSGKKLKASIPERIWHLLGCIGIVGTLASFASGRFWLADLVAQLWVQFGLLIALAIPLWLWRRKTFILGLGALSLTANLWVLFPYVVSKPQPPGVAATSASAKPLRLAIFNVLRTNAEIAATLEEAITDSPDFLFLMEVSPDWKKPLEDLQDVYPHQKRICREDYTGVAFLSKRPWTNLEVVDVAGANPPLDVAFRIEGHEPFRLLLTHPLPPISPDLWRDRDEQLLSLADTTNTGPPALFAGDFNLAPWSAHFTELLQRGNFSDASLGYGIQPTLTPLPTWLGGVKVDHVLISGDISIANYRVGTTRYSDHCRVIVDFTVPPM